MVSHVTTVAFQGIEAVPVDVQAPEHAGFRAALLEIYVPRYGPEWEEFLDSGVAYARIDADRMLTFHA